MTIDTRAREAARRAREDVAAIEVPAAEAVVGRRRARRHARFALASGAVVLLVAGAGVGVAATRDGSSPQVAVTAPSPPAAPPRAGLSFTSFHSEGCPLQGIAEAGIDGCVPVPDSGTSSAVASASVRNDNRNGSVIDLTLTPAAAKRFADDSIFIAYIDGVHINVVRGPNGTLVLSGDAARPWDGATAEVLAQRILATR
jgi:hypothetical protein